MTLGVRDVFLHHVCSECVSQVLVFLSRELVDLCLILGLPSSAEGQDTRDFNQTAGPQHLYNCRPPLWSHTLIWFNYPHPPVNGQMPLTMTGPHLPAQRKTKCVCVVHTSSSGFIGYALFSLFFYVKWKHRDTYSPLLTTPWNKQWIILAENVLVVYKQIHKNASFVTVCFTSCGL